MATTDQTLLKVQRLLTGPMELSIQLHGELITVSFRDSSTPIHIRVQEGGKYRDGSPRTMVTVSSPLLRGVTPKPELYEHIVRKIPRLWFGSVAVWDDTATPGTVMLALGHTLLGEFLDEEELRAVVFGVLGCANELDDLLQKEFGGKRWTDS